MQSQFRLLAAITVLLLLALAGCSYSSSQDTTKSNVPSSEVSGATAPINGATGSSQGIMNKQGSSEDAKATTQKPGQSAAPDVPRSQDTTKNTNGANAIDQTAEPSTGTGLIQLVVTDPEDEAELDSADVRVAGRTAPGAVVSVDDTATLADQQGFFAITLHVDETPHTIDIVASDRDGNQIGENRTVFTK